MMTIDQDNKSPRYGAFVKIDGRWQRRYDALAYRSRVKAAKALQNWLLAPYLSGIREEGETERGIRKIKA